MVTSYQDALELSTQPNKLLCSDLDSLQPDPTVSAGTIAQLRAEAKEKDVLIATQAATIVNLRAAIQETLQDANKFVKDARKRLKQA
jgi:hypothetical protein